MNIASAYPVEGLKLLRREFVNGEYGVTVTDTIDYVGEGIVTERFVTLHEPKIEADAVIIKDAKLSFDPSVATPYIGEEMLSSGAICYLINFDLPEGTERFSITIE